MTRSEIEQQLRAALDWIAYGGRELQRGDTKQADNALERAASTIRVVLDAHEHVWSHAPTVGYFRCDCGERIDHDDPRYGELLAKQVSA
jgi:transketolase